MIPWAVLAIFVVGIGIGLYLRRVDAERHRSIGRVVYEAPEADDLAGAPLPA